MKLKLSLVIITCLVLIAIICLPLAAVNREPSLDYTPNNSYNQTIIVTADENYPPFSYINEEGIAVGSDIELIYAIANEMQVNVDLRLTEWPEPCNLVENGQADLVLGIEYADYYIGKFSLSSPVEINQFVAFGKKPYGSLQNIYNYRIGVLDCSSTKNFFTKPMALQDDVIVFECYEDAFEAISNNELDYFIGRFPLGNRVLANEEINDIRAVGSVLVSDAFCFGVHKNNLPLQQKMNIAIKNLNEQGVLSEISSKWLGDFSKDFTLQNYLLNRSKQIIIVFLIVVVLISCFVILKIRKLHYKSQIDLTTQLMNKKSTESLIKESLLKTQTHCGTLFLIDLDNLKIINDTLGHLSGDACILTVTKILKQMFHKDDIIGRIGGDEFLVFVKNIAQQEFAQTKTKLLLEELEKENSSGAIKHHITISIGIAFYDGQDSFENLFTQADIALYKAKKNGRNQGTVYPI